MKGQLNVSSVEEYLGALDEPIRGDITRLDQLIRAVAPELSPFIYMGMPAYGAYRYRYASGREGDGARIAVASNKQYISLYVAGGCEGEDIASEYQDRLPKANVGRCCIRFRRLSELDEGVLIELFKNCATNYP